MAPMTMDVSALQMLSVHLACAIMATVLHLASQHIPMDHSPMDVTAK
jgi:hypothetical protein